MDTLVEMSKNPQGKSKTVGISWWDIQSITWDLVETFKAVWLCLRKLWGGP